LHIRNGRSRNAPPAPKPGAAAQPATPAAAAPAAKPALEVPAKYAYCNAYGSPARSTTPKHLYISQAFQIPPGERANQTEAAFEKYVGAAHPGESISASCLAPGALEVTQQNRQTNVDRQRKQPAKLDVVEVDWKR
jgi:hypothetical protein